MSFFKKKHTLAKRQKRCRDVRFKFPTRIPVIVERAPSSDVPLLDKFQFLVPSDLTMGQFGYVIRRRLSLPPEKAVFLFCNNSIAPTSAVMSAVYEKYKDKEDGLLYVIYAGENTFG
jgi:GABA(A) receptor-associated protein